MFLDYKKPPTELVADLINRDNPDLPFPIKASECFFGIPANWSLPGDYRDTQVNITPRSNSPYIGGFKVQYRRLNTPSLFPSGSVTMFDWYAAATLPIAEFLTAFNQATGMAVTGSDIASTTFGVMARGGNRTLSFSAGSLAFKGSVNISFQGEFPVNAHVTDTPNLLVHWDGVPRNNVAALRRYTTCGHDFSAWSAYLESLSTSAASFNVLNEQAINLVSYIADITGQPFNVNSIVDTLDPFTLYGAYSRRWVLPESAPNQAVEFFLEGFNRCVTIYRSAKTGNLPDRLYLYYNVKP